MAKKKQQEPQKLEFAKQLEQAFEHWDIGYKNGIGDPNYADGSGLNYRRNRIVYLKEEIEKELVPSDFPEIYHRETPQEVANDFMANPDEIRSAAKSALDIFSVDENYLLLKSQLPNLDKKIIKQTCANTVVGYVSSLENSIARDDLLRMRFYKEPKRYIESFVQCLNQIESMKQKADTPVVTTQSTPQNQSAQTNPLEISIKKEQNIMGKETLQITFDTDKLEALQFYMAEKELTIEGELQNHLNGLYEKNVPAPTRRFLERNDEPSEKTAKQEDVPKKSGMTDEEKSEYNRQRREQRKAAKEQSVAPEQSNMTEQEQSDALEIDEGEEESQGMGMSM